MIVCQTNFAGRTDAELSAMLMEVFEKHSHPSDLALDALSHGKMIKDRVTAIFKEDSSNIELSCEMWASVVMLSQFRSQANAEAPKPQVAFADNPVFSASLLQVREKMKMVQTSDPLMQRA